MQLQPEIPQAEEPVIPANWRRYEGRISRVLLRQHDDLRRLPGPTVAAMGRRQALYRPRVRQRAADDR